MTATKSNIPPITTMLHWTGSDFRVRMADELVCSHCFCPLPPSAVTCDTDAIALICKRKIGLAGKAPEQSLCLCVPEAPDPDDLVEAETLGSGRFAVQVKHPTRLLDELKGDGFRIDAGAHAGSAILITDPDDSHFTIIQMPCVWMAEVSQA